jgi:N-methylhydantoinase A
VGAQALAMRIGLDKLITFDMGGTTAKASLVEDNAISRATEYQVGGGIMHGSRLLTGAGYLLRVPAIDLAEVGAGRGSIVWRDAGGACRSGHGSAGASPGPLCYDLGGAEPTGHRRQRHPRLPESDRAGRRRGQAQRHARARGASRSASPSRWACRSPRPAYGAHLIAART